MEWFSLCKRVEIVVLFVYVLFSYELVLNWLAF